MWGRQLCGGQGTTRRNQFSPPHKSWGLKSSLQAWQQALLHTEPSHQCPSVFQRWGKRCLFSVSFKIIAWSWYKVSLQSILISTVSFPVLMRDLKKQTLSTVRKICPFHTKHWCPYDCPWMMTQGQLMLTGHLRLVCECVWNPVYEDDLWHDKVAERCFWRVLGLVWGTWGDVTQAKMWPGRRAQWSLRKHRNCYKWPALSRLWPHNSQDSWNCPAGECSPKCFLPGNWQPGLPGI